MKHTVLSIVFAIVFCSPVAALESTQDHVAGEQEQSWSMMQVITNVVGAFAVAGIGGICVGIAWRLNDAR